VVVLGIQGNRVRLGLLAPSRVTILREEVQSRADWATAEWPAEVAECASDTGGVLL
jgi:sRNA-binding carbon storage regulator CsrA